MIYDLINYVRKLIFPHKENFNIKSKYPKIEYDFSKITKKLYNTQEDKLKSQLEKLSQFPIMTNRLCADTKRKISIFKTKKNGFEYRLIDYFHPTTPQKIRDIEFKEGAIYIVWEQFFSEEEVSEMDFSDLEE